MEKPTANNLWLQPKLDGGVYIEPARLLRPAQAAPYNSHHPNLSLHICWGRCQIPKSRDHLQTSAIQVHCFVDLASTPTTWNLMFKYLLFLFWSEFWDVGKFEICCFTMSTIFRDPRIACDSDMTKSRSIGSRICMFLKSQNWFVMISSVFQKSSTWPCFWCVVPAILLCGSGFAGFARNPKTLVLGFVGFPHKIRKLLA